MVNINSSSVMNVNFKANIMPKNQAQHIDNILHAGKSVDIICHNHTDEDSFNSATAFYKYLKDEGIKPRIIVSDEKEVFEGDKKKFNIIKAQDVNTETKKADVALCLDFSSETRVTPNVLKHLQRYDEKNIIGIDHHNTDKFHSSYNHITKAYQANQMPEVQPKNYYIDSSSRSNCGIVYRFFEALGIKPSKEISKSLYAGFKDDVAKSTEALDVNTKDIEDKLEKSTDFFDKLKVKDHFLAKSLYRPNELKFSDGLLKRTQYSQNGKFAYVEIKQDDKEWNDIDRNTSRSEKLLGKYRQWLLEHDKNIEAVAVFYPCNDQQTYKMSMLSNKNYAKKIVDYAKDSCPEQINAGGHDNRCGGTLISNDPVAQNLWVKNFVSAAENINY